MGYLYYGDSDDPFELPDTLLAHLKVVITTKLRRRESFTLTWKHVDGAAHHRSALWLQEAIPLRFVFSSAEVTEVQPPVLQEFAQMANSANGLTVDMAEWTEPSRAEALPSAA
jgi:hypothetical protein